jgi:thioredoxin 1
MFQIISTNEEYDEAIEFSKNNLVVIDFFASWCGPCKRMIPLIEGLAQEIPEVQFVGIDVDDADSWIIGDVGFLPTFHIFKNMVKVAELNAADIHELKRLILQHNY